MSRNAMSAELHLASTIPSNPCHDAFVAEQIIKDQGWRKVNGQLLCEDCYDEYLKNDKNETN